MVDAEGIVVGVVSETDLLTSALERQPHRWPHRKHATTAELTARDLMTHPAVTTSLDEPVASVARLMSARKLRRLPVVDGQGHPAGIVCRADVLSKNTLLAVDAASHEPARHVLAAAAMTRDLSRDSGDHVIVVHVHEFATGRFGRIQVD